LFFFIRLSVIVIVSSIGTSILRFYLTFRLDVVLLGGMDSLLMPLPEYNWDVWAAFIFIGYILTKILMKLRAACCGA
jgi:hypothetical protein